MLIVQITWPSGASIKLNTFVAIKWNEFGWKERVFYPSSWGRNFCQGLCPRWPKKCAFEEQQKALEGEIQSIRTWHDYFMFLFIYGARILFYFVLFLFIPML